MRYLLRGDLTFTIEVVGDGEDQAAALLAAMAGTTRAVTDGLSDSYVVSDFQWTNVSSKPVDSVGV